MSYFNGSGVATSYAASRPYFHPLVIERLPARLGVSRLPLALDVACGTGQSTSALLALAARVVGTDFSSDMLAAAGPSPRIDLVAANAEELPFAPGAFPLLTVALAFHWFDRARFLREAQRVLAPGGWLVIYNNAFFGQMRGNPAFEEWLTGTYLARYPSPPRDRQPFTDTDAAEFGFDFVERETYQNVVEFSREELVRYLMTQSNIIAAVNAGHERYGAVEEWLTQQLQPLFQSERATFVFGGTIWYLRKR
ncbi:MAG TPA: methyltransferase domain-containing protein [Thermomicrobiaceae bacterium]|nr:methyltransferase domain-containing protein [Thermomicrobiaceae bacterium]